MEAPPKRDIKSSFEHVTNALNKLRDKDPQLYTEANQKIATFIRSITGGQYINLPIYQAAGAIDPEAKFQTYKQIFTALVCPGGPDFSMLECEEKEKPDAQNQPPVQTTAVPTTEKTVPRPHAEGNVPEPETEESDSLAREIIRLVEKRAKVGAQMDEDQVAMIVRAEIVKFQKDFEGDFKALLEEHLNNGSFPTNRVEEIVKKLGGGATRIEFVNDKGDLKSVEGLVHPQVTELATWLRAGVPVWGYGAAGSGKTHMARQIAAILDVPAYVMSVDPTLTVSKIMGYRNVADGGFIEGFAYKPFKEGGVFAQDEIDTGDPGVIASSNALLSNGHYLFPNGETVPRNDKFYALALANTKGMGAVAGYTARNRLDAATLDRFAIIEIKYDAGLESALSCGIGKPGEPWKPGKPASLGTQQRYVEWVQRVRAFVKDSVLVSPRASINGCKALRAGVPLDEVTSALVFKLVTDDTRKRIIDQCSLPKEG